MGLAPPLSKRAVSRKDANNLIVSADQPAVPAAPIVMPEKVPPLLRASSVLNGVRELAPHFVRYDFVETGYRYHFTVLEGLQGIFALHFETLNIWTHLLGFVYFLWAIPRVASVLKAGNASFTDECYYWAFLAAAMVQMLTSTCYHVFRCMSASWEAFLLRLDILGVVAMIQGSYAIALYNGFWCEPEAHAVYLGVTLLLLGTGCGLMMFPGFQEPRWMFLRNLVLAGSVAFGVIPATHWTFLSTTCDERCFWTFISSLSKMFASYGVGFLLFSCKIPERWWPGMFDLVGSSHQLWHILVWAAGAAWLEGMLQHFQWRTENLRVCPGTPDAASIALGSML